MLNVRNLTTVLHGTQTLYKDVYLDDVETVCSMVTSYPTQAKEIHTQTVELRTDVNADCTGGAPDARCNEILATLNELVKQAKNTQDAMKTSVHFLSSFSTSFLHFSTSFYFLDILSTYSIILTQSSRHSLFHLHFSTFG